MRTFLRVLMLGATLATGASAAEAPQYLAKNADWYRSDEGKHVIANIVSWQNHNGGWFKGYDAAEPRPAVLPEPKSPIDPLIPENDRPSVWHLTSTIDNKATYSEIRLLARAYTATNDESAHQAFDRGLAYLLAAQYPNGGWPQRYPLQDNYGRRITFNDGAMVGVMEVLRDVAAGKRDFAFVSQADRKKASEAFQRGVDCVLHCQIQVNGHLTAWCQQHDEKTLVPAGGRAFELPGIAADESAGIVLMLMSLEHPSPEVKASIRSAVQWFEASKVDGKRLLKKDDPARPGKFDAQIVDDRSAPTAWYRYYDIETNRPFFAGRDGVKRWSLTEVEPERRAGYAWLRPWGVKVLERYPAWDAANRD
jgi:PelA/Pel-15E family pectate lyase